MLGDAPRGSEPGLCVSRPERTNDQASYMLKPQFSLLMQGSGRPNRRPRIATEAQLVASGGAAVDGAVQEGGEGAFGGGFVQVDSPSHVWLSFQTLYVPSPGILPPLNFVYVAQLDDGRYIDRPDLVEKYEIIWGHLQAAAFGPKDSVEFVKGKVANRYSLATRKGQCRVRVRVST